MVEDLPLGLYVGTVALILVFFYSFQPLSDARVEAKGRSRPLIRWL